MNRRNVLIGIGTAAVGSGAALGSGAFTTVSADRTLNISTAGDDSANLQLVPDSDAESAGFITTTTGTNGEDIIEMDLSALNDDAVTTIDPIFTVQNGMGEGVGFRIRSDAYSSGEPSGLTIESTNGNPVDSYPTANGDDNNLDGGGDSVAIRISVDTTQLDLSTDPISSITVEATTDEYTT